MTFEDIQKLYNSQMKMANEEYGKWRQSNAIFPPASRDSYDGFRVDYDGIGQMLIHTAQDDFRFTEKQAVFIYNFVHVRYHSTFSDVISEMENYCEIFEKWNKLSA